MREMMPEAETAFLSAELTLTRPLAQLGARGTGNIHTDVTKEQAEQLVDEVEQYLKRIAENAKGCCIDGRGCERCLNNEPTELGPKVAGGPLMTAFAAAEMIGWFADDAGEVENRLRIIKEKLETEGIVIGAHVDEGAVAAQFRDTETGKPKTGCGADDKATEIVDRVYTDENMYALVQTLLGENYEESSMQFVSRELASNTFADWDPVVPLVVAKDKAGGNIEALAGGHAEALVIFNYNENTTFDRDAFQAETGRQAFCVDMWYIKKLARVLSTGPEAADQAKELEHAMVAYQVGTYLTLCDGSQRAVLAQAKVVA